MTEDVNTFITNFLNKNFLPYLNVEPNEKNDKYLTSMMRNSIVERILTRFVFQYEIKRYNLYYLLDHLKYQIENSESGDSNKEYMKSKHIFEFFRTKLGQSESLYFYSKIAEDLYGFIEKLSKDSKEYKDFTLEDDIRKIEAWLAQHLESNFFPQRQHKKIDDQYFNENFVKQSSDQTNFNFTCSSLVTTFKILKVLEKQSLSCKDPENLLAHEDGFISEKKLYNYLERLGKNKIAPNNLIDYIIQNIEKKCYHLYGMSQEKLNNYEIENHLCFNLFVIYKIIKDYSFYVDKKPELEKIFLNVKKYKNWPLPVGSFGMELYEMLINELYFQGITLINQLRETFFIDLIGPKVSSIQTKFFVSAVIVYSDEAKEDKSGDDNKHDLMKVINYLCAKEKNHPQLKLRDFMIKIFLTVVMNSNEKYTSATLENIIKKFALYDNNSNPMDNIIQNNLTNSSNSEISIKIDLDEGMEKKQQKTQEDNTKVCLETLLKIIDVGLDKSYDDFMQDITMIAQPLVSLSDHSMKMYQLERTPITEYRYFLKPQYYDKKKISTFHNGESEFGYLDIFEIYRYNFQSIFNNYFSHLRENINDNEEKRTNLYKTFRIKLVLIEEKRVISSFIENLDNVYKYNLNDKIGDEEFRNFWSLFVKRKEDIEVKFLLYVVPHYENPKEHPFRLSGKNEIADHQNLLSEFIATHDSIYKNIVFLPWASPKDAELTDYFKAIEEININNETRFKSPNADTFYSFLKEPLDLYLSDSRGLLNLNLYTCSIGERERIFWKCVDFTMDVTNKAKLENKNKNKKENSSLPSCVVTLHCVDMLGIECKDEEKVVLHLQEPFQIKIFNLFYRKNAPFNYNMSSNNGWLEVFICENYSKTELDKIPNFKHAQQYTSSKIAYFEEFVIPQMELDSIYKNYKVKAITIEPTGLFALKLDENVEPVDVDSSKISIGKYERNGEHVSLPIATFTSI